MPEPPSSRDGTAVLSRPDPPKLDYAAEQPMRFRFEGEAVAALRHPNVVQLYEIGTWEGQPYLVLEYVEGGTLSSRLRAGRLGAAEATRLVEVLARAVQAAHNHGVVHRDLKPGDVLLSSDTSYKTHESYPVVSYVCRASK